MTKYSFSEHYAPYDEEPRCFDYETLKTDCDALKAGYQSLKAALHQKARKPKTITHRRVICRETIRGMTMPDNKPKLGEGIVDELTSVANEEISNLGKLAIRSVFKYLSDNFQDFDIDDWLAG